MLLLRTLVQEQKNKANPLCSISDYDSGFYSPQAVIHPLQPHSSEAQTQSSLMISGTPANSVGGELFAIFLINSLLQSMVKNSHSPSPFPSTQLLGTGPEEPSAARWGHVSADALRPGTRHSPVRAA